MASKFTYELDLNTKGYTDGVKAGKNANADFVSSLNKMKGNLPNLRKELAAARKEVNGLSLAYSRLSEEEKKSGFGQLIARELDEAKQRTAELIDMSGDLQTELKNMASDTAAWDAMKQGIGIAKDATVGLIGTIAQLGGKEKELQPIIAKIAQVQGIANAAIGIGNALQKQSAVMIGIARIQKLAMVKATELEAAATTKATIAQRLFNTVAKANPYVLLASAVLAVGAALGTYFILANKATNVTDKLNTEMHEASVQGQKDAQADIVKLDLLYNKTQDVSLSIDERKKAVDKLQEQYPGYFSNLSTEQILLGQASEKYQQLKDDIIAVAKAKAYQGKLEELAKQNIELEDQLETQRKITEEHKKREKIAEDNYHFNGQNYVNFAATNQARLADDSRQAEKRLQEQIEANNAAMDRYAGAINEVSESFERLEENETIIKDNNKPIKPTADTTEVKAVTGSIEDLEKQIGKLQDRLKKGLVPKEEIEATKANIKALQSQVRALKIEYGFEEPAKAKTKLEELTAKLEEQQKAYILAVDANDEQAKQEALKAYYAAQRELENYKLSIKIEALPDEQTITKQRAEIQKIVSNALNFTIEPTYDFSNLPEMMQQAASQAMSKLKQVEDAQKKLSEIMQNPGSSDTQIAAAQQGLDNLHETWQKLTEDVKAYSAANEEIGKQQKSMQQLSNTVTGVGNAVQAVGSMFSALGDASEDNDMKAMGIVAQAVATVALSFAQALQTAKTWVDWLAFGVSGMATMVTMISQIKSLTSGSYAGGGIIPGSSYYGDRLTANVNSGEMILNKRQQRNLFDAIDQNKIAAVGQPANVYVTGRIQGKDLLLVQKNANKIFSKSGQHINI